MKFAADVRAAAATLFEVCCPRKASLFSVPPGTFVRETEEQTAKAIREMATARSFKLMPYDQTMQDVLEKTFVPAEKATLVAGLASHPGQRAVGLAVHRQARLRRLTFLTGRRGRKQQESFENSSSSTVLGDCPPTLRSLARRMKRSLCSQAVAFTQFVCYSR